MNIDETIERRIRENNEVAAPNLTVGQWRAVLHVIDRYKAGTNGDNLWNLEVAQNARGGIIDAIEEAIGHR